MQQNQTADVISASTPEIICQYLSSHLGGEISKNGNQFEIHGQGGLYVDVQGRIAKPADGKQAGGKGLLPAIIYCKTGGQWTADKDTFKSALQEACELLHIPFNGNSIRTFPKQKSSPKIDYNNPAKIYSYVDENGKELFQNCRYEWQEKTGKQKTFRQRCKDKEGQWIYTLQNIRHVPYHLPSLLKEPELICDCEGEKDAETLITMGFTATTVNKMTDEELKEFAPVLKGKTVAVFEDNDTPGRESGEKRGRTWYKSGAMVKRICFDQMPEKSDVTDWVECDRQKHDGFEIAKIINETPSYSPINDILIDFFHVPSPRAPLMSIDERHVVAEGEIFGIVSGIGTGKSHLAELFAALAINPDCEPESKTQVSLKAEDKCILIDNERTEDDCFYALERIWNRTGQHPDSRTVDKRHFKQVQIAHVTHLAKADRLERLKDVIETPGLKLLILDGALGFVSNPNDTELCIQFVEWLHQQANKYNIGIVYTLHGNRNDETGKGKGWLGAELQRLSATFLRLHKHDKNPEIRLLTSQFDNVKVRSGKDSGLTVALTWDDDAHDFRCIEYSDGEAPDHKDEFEWCFLKANKERMLQKELVTIYSELTHVSTKTARRHIKKAIDIILEEEPLGTQIFLRLKK